MERLPEMFGVIRPGYDKHEYISLYKNTIEMRKCQVYNHAAPRRQRWLEMDLEWNMIEYVPLRGVLLHEEFAYSTYESKQSIVCLKNTRSNPSTMTSLQRGHSYNFLPFSLYCDGERYPVISFYHTSFLPGRVGATYKLVLTAEEKQSISLALRVVGQWVNNPDPDENNEDAPIMLQNDVKEPEPVPSIPNKLPTFVIENHMNYEIARSECPIASIALKECDRVSILDCYHVFDSSSIHTWMRIKAECPVCKSKSTIIHTLSVSKSISSESVSSASSVAPKNKMKESPAGEIIGLFTDTIKDNPAAFEKQLDEFIWLSKNTLLQFNRVITSLQEHPMQFLPAAYGPKLEALFHIKQKLETKHHVRITIDHKWFPGKPSLLRQPGQPFYQEIEYISWDL